VRPHVLKNGISKTYTCKAFHIQRDYGKHCPRLLLMRSDVWYKHMVWPVENTGTSSTSYSDPMSECLHTRQSSAVNSFVPLRIITHTLSRHKKTQLEKPDLNGF